MAKRDTCPSCGREKDKRAKECQSCGHSRQTTRQWANEETRSRILSGIREVHRARRRTFDKIAIDIRWMYKREDGRAFAYYWDGDRKRYIYRYQWVWIKANGPIPSDHDVHHRNHDCTDDRLENLELLPATMHRKHHGPDFSRRGVIARGETPMSDEERNRVCEGCGKPFQIKFRSKANRFCSLPCYHQSLRTA